MRPEHNPWHPVHVTIQIVGNVNGLRRRDTYLALREATIVTARREDFRDSPVLWPLRPTYHPLIVCRP